MTAPNNKIAKKEARSVINKWAMGFAGIAWLPGSQLALSGGDVLMVIQVGKIYGFDLDKTEALGILTSIAATITGRTIVHSLLDFVPVIGWGAKPVVAASVTKAVGKALIAYFEERSNLPD